MCAALQGWGWGEAFYPQAVTSVGQGTGSTGCQRLSLSISAHRILNLEHKHPPLCVDFFFFFFFWYHGEVFGRLPVYCKRRNRQTGRFRYLCLCKHFRIIGTNHQMVGLRMTTDHQPQPHTGVWIGTWEMGRNGK